MLAPHVQAQGAVVLRLALLDLGAEVGPLLRNWEGRRAVGRLRKHRDEPGNFEGGEGSVLAGFCTVAPNIPIQHSNQTNKTSSAHVVKVEQLGRAQQQRQAGLQQLRLVVHEGVDEAAVPLRKPHEGGLFRRRGSSRDRRRSE